MKNWLFLIAVIILGCSGQKYEQSPIGGVHSNISTEKEFINNQHIVFEDLSGSVKSGKVEDIFTTFEKLGLKKYKDEVYSLRTKDKREWLLGMKDSVKYYKYHDALLFIYFEYHEILFAIDIYNNKSILITGLKMDVYSNIKLYKANDVFFYQVVAQPTAMHHFDDVFLVLDLGRFLFEVFYIKNSFYFEPTDIDLGEDVFEVRNTIQFDSIKNKLMIFSDKELVRYKRKKAVTIKYEELEINFDFQKCSFILDPALQIDTMAQVEYYRKLYIEAGEQYPEIDTIQFN